MGLIDRLGPGPVGLDTAIFIYWIEESPRFMPQLEPLFAAIDRGLIAAVTSQLTLLETLVVPLRENDLLLAERYEAILGASRGLSLLPIDLEVLRAAARIRAATAARTPDAIQLATALAAGCTAFVTGDRRVPSLPRLPVVSLSGP